MPEERHVIAERLLKQHLGDQAARAEALNMANGPGIDGVPIYGDIIGSQRPALPRNEAPGGMMPVQQPGAMQIRGYLDENEEMTPMGEEFLALVDAGMFDDRGNLTAEGKAFGMTREEARDEEDNLESFIIRQKAGLDEDPDGGSLADVTWNLGRDFIRGVGIVAGRPVQRLRNERFEEFARMDGIFTDEEKRELEEIKKKESYDAIALQETGKQTLTGAATLMAGSNSGFGQLAAKLEGNEYKFYAAKQAHARQVAEFNDASAGELWGGAIGSMEAITRLEKTAADAEAMIGAEQAEKARREGGAASILTDPSTILTMGVGGFVGKGGVALSMAAKAEKAALARLAALEATAARASAETVAKRSAELSRRAASRADNLQALGKDSAMARSFSERMATRSAEAWDDVAKLDDVITIRTGDVAKLTKDARVAEALMGIGERARALRAVPFKAFGELAERMGAGIMKLDDGLREAATKYGFESVGKVLSSPLTPVAIGAITAGPVGAVVAAAGRALASGPVLKSIGNFSRVVGAETLQRRGMMPFWQRVANNSTLTPVARATAHLLDTATLGGKAGIPLRMAAQAVKGTAAAAPIDMAFEVVESGFDMDANKFKQAIAESILFGGGSGVVAGSMNDLQKQQLGDEINFRNGLVDREVLAFGRMNPGARRVLSSYAAANPALRFNLTTEGNSFMDRTSNTMTLNTRQSDWMAPIIGHEVSHFIQIKGQMESGITAMLVGDGVTGGILRAPDGSLNPDFKRFADAYNGRLVAQGINPLPVGDIAIEYFTESTVDDITTMVESGELARMAGRSNAERMVREMSRNLIGRVPFIRDLSMKFGTGMDRGGRMVMGTGILADGVRTIPGARAMLRGLMREQAGRRGDGVISEESATIPVQIMRDDPAMRSAMFSTLETDAAGNPIVDANGNVSITSRETELRRMAAGLIITELEAERIANGRQLPEGELAPQTDGSWQGTHLSPESLQRLADSGVFNAKQLAMLGMLNRSAKGLTGETFMMIYQAATIPRKGKRKGYGTLPATFREVVPVGVKITKDGNIIVETMSVTQLVENVRDRAASKRGKRLYNGNQVEILRDAQAVLDLHRKGERTDAYFADKYGSINGPEYKNFVNTAFGLMTRSQQDVNPIFAEDSIRAGGVFKSRRLDRINQTTRMQGKPLFRFGYEQVKANLAPNGIPDPNPRMLPAPLTLESPEWKGMSIADKMDYVFSPVEMTAEQRAEYDAAVQAGSLTAGTPVVAKDRQQFLTARYGLASAAPRGKMSVWSDDNGSVAVAFRESGTNMPTRSPDVRMLPQERPALEPETITGVSKVESSSDAKRVGTAKLGTKAKPLETPNTSNISTALVPDSVLKEQMEKMNYKHMPKDIIDEPDYQAKREKLIDWFTKNLLALHDAVAPAIRERATHWYDGANRIARNFSKIYEVSLEQASGVLAVFSPQKDWFMNVAQGEQFLYIWSKLRNMRLTPELINAELEHIVNAAAATSKQKMSAPKDEAGNKLPETFVQEAARKKHNDAANRQAVLDRRNLLEQIKGKTISELEGNPKLEAWAVRILAQSYFGTNYRVVAPEGDAMEVARKKDKDVDQEEFDDDSEDADDELESVDDNARNGWGSTEEIMKAIRIMRDGSISNISNNLGEKHKVRNFYNNIVAPNNPFGDATIDTHAVAAAHLFPMGSGHVAVGHNFGSSIPGAKAGGVDGNYHLYLEAYQRAAAAREIMPRQMQSITWEAIRGLYSPESRRDKNFIAEVTQTWQTDPDARRSIIDRGISSPAWARPGNAGEHLGGSGKLRQDGDGSEPGADLLFGGGRRPAGRVGKAAPSAKRPVTGTAGVKIRRGGDGTGSGRAGENNRGSTRNGSRGALTAEQFVEIAGRNKANHPFGSSVDVYTPEEYDGYDLIVVQSKGDTVTATISPDGELGGVTSSGKNPKLVEKVMKAALETGKVKWLNGYDTILPRLYGSYGFETVSRIPFDPKFQKPDFINEKYQKFNGGYPDVVFMRYTGRPHEYSAKKGLKLDSYDAAVDHIKTKVAKGKTHRPDGVRYVPPKPPKTSKAKVDAKTAKAIKDAMR